MNNNIIKSLRRTVLCTVAIAAVAIGFTACADDSLVTPKATAPVNGTNYKFSIPANMGGGDTRAIAYNSETGGYDALFETSDFIYVYNVTKDAYGQKKIENEKGDYSWMEDSYLQPDANGKTANLVGELGFWKYDYDENEWFEIIPEKDDELMLFYNIRYTQYNQSIDYNRDFSYDYNYNSKIADYALATVKITSTDDGVIKTEPSSFQNPQSIYKVNFTGIGSDVKIKKVTIGSEQRKLVSYYRPTNVGWPNEFGNVTYIYKEEGIAQDDLIFLLRFADNSNDDQETESTSGDVLSFFVEASDGHYYKGTKSITTDLENGKYYQADVTMADAGLAMTLTNTITGELVKFNYSSIGINTRDASYIAENTGYDKRLEWYGGNNTLTLKDVSVYNTYDCFILAFCYNDPEGSDETKVHKLILDGVNTLNRNYYYDYAINVEENSSLIISAQNGGKLNTNATIRLSTNATLLIESGEVTADCFNYSDNVSVLLSGDAKLRVRGSYDYIKGASGYILNTTTDGEYTVYTVTAAPPYEDPIALSAATTADIGKIVGSDGKVHVLHWDLPEGVSPVGMLASISSTGHGLAIAKDIQVKKSYEWGGYDIYYNFSWDDSYWMNEGKTATEIFNDWAAENSVGFGTWRIPTKADCQNMILSCRIDGDATEASDENMVANGFGSKLTEAEIYRYNYINYMSCWTGTQLDDEWMLVMGLYYHIDEGASIANFYSSNLTDAYRIFPVLEF